VYVHTSYSSESLEEELEKFNPEKKVKGDTPQTKKKKKARDMLKRKLS